MMLLASLKYISLTHGMVKIAPKICDNETHHERSFEQIVEVWFHKFVKNVNLLRNYKIGLQMEFLNQIKIKAQDCGHTFMENNPAISKYHDFFFSSSFMSKLHIK